MYIYISYGNYDVSSRCNMCLYNFVPIIAAIQTLSLLRGKTNWNGQHFARCQGAPATSSGSSAVVAQGRRSGDEWRLAVFLGFFGAGYFAKKYVNQFSVFLCVVATMGIRMGNMRFMIFIPSHHLAILCNFISNESIPDIPSMFFFNA